MVDVEIVSNLPWQPGGRVAKYADIYRQLTRPTGERWVLATFETVELAKRAQFSIRAHARRQGWTIQTTCNGYRLGVRRVM